MNTETQSMHLLEKAVEQKVKLLLTKQEEQRLIEIENNYLSLNGLQLDVPSVLVHTEKTLEIRKTYANKIKEIGKQYEKVMLLLNAMYPNKEELERAINNETVKAYQLGKYTL
ncbi:hypothetical protein [Bacillus toyonensis]|uniref:hypothetical protein n=1 Tax=Bacillus toyonensis TaxID=155322 RepID=UPI000BF48432|nr:hypothetical protein [Bacillus toyonensis]PGF05122.1 hypothetical protein COM61_01480 [Bacillus toyonensis]